MNDMIRFELQNRKSGILIRYNKLRKFRKRRNENRPQKTRDKVSVIW